MEDLYFNLSEKEFSKGRKILLWIFGTIFIIIGLWDLYLKIFKHDSYAKIGLTITSLGIGLFVYLIAFLSISGKKGSFFRIDSAGISYRFGLLSPVHREFAWNSIITVYMPPKQKNIFISEKTGIITGIKLAWIEKNRARIIKKHIYYGAKERNIEIVKKSPKKR